MKKKILSIACVLVSAITFAQLPTDGLVAHYPFNGNANDESTNSNDGTVNGATLTTDRFGNVNSAYSFDGVDDYIFLGNNIFKNNLISISGWYKLTNKNNVNPIFSSGEASLSNNGMRIEVDNNTSSTPNTLQIVMDTRSCGGELAYKQTKDTIKNELWYHFLITVSDTTTFYINGVKVGDTITAGTSNTVNGYWLDDLCSGNHSTYIGRWLRSSNDVSFNGDIDDLRLYDRVLAQCEITSLFNENDTKLKVTVQDTLNIYLSSIITTVYEPADAATTVKVYPNPTENEVTVSIDNYTNLSGVTLKVINSQSAEVHSEAVTGSTQSIDVSSWSAGIYFLQVLNGTDIVDIRKIVVNN